MKYISTRGQVSAQSFEDVVLTGMASDGGLYVPEEIPQFSGDEIASWAKLPYNELAFKVIQPFVGNEIADHDLKDIIDRSYTNFRHTAIAPLIQLESNLWVMELFHGPTLAFKDFALQFLGNLFDHLLEKRNEKVVVMGATSGDTGSAAIEGCCRCKNIDLFILHPHNRVSDVQRRQMTTVLQSNVHNIALQGNFDDCQNIVKASFADQSFLPKGRKLAAVNSINWARIVAQVVYYFHASLSLGGPHRAISFSVPTGNFGDIFAGYIAKQMGLPIEQLVIATNANDVLHRCISNNDLSKQPLIHSLSPSMDIMISSNFERLLFDLYNRDGAAITNLMTAFNEGSASLKDSALIKARELFSSFCCDDKRVVEVIARVYEENEYLLDPHTATGIEAAQQVRRRSTTPMVCLSTAHPAKFPEAVRKAGYPKDPELPDHMADLFEREERYTIKANDLKIIQQFVAENVDV